MSDPSPGEVGGIFAGITALLAIIGGGLKWFRGWEERRDQTRHDKLKSDARGWIGLGCFVMALLVLAMIKFERELLDSDAFLILATAIIITGWVQGPVGWAYQATKAGGELADTNAEIIKQRSASDSHPPSGLNDGDRPAGTPTDPVRTTGETR